MATPIFIGIRYKVKMAMQQKNRKATLTKKHIEYWDECIDNSYRPVDMKLEESLIAPAIQKLILDTEVEKSTLEKIQRPKHKSYSEEEVLGPHGLDDVELYEDYGWE